MPGPGTRPWEVRTRTARRTSGQSMVETIISLSLVMMIVLGLIHLSLLAVTRHVGNFAAFSAARILVYGSGELPRAQEAVVTTLRMLPEGTEYRWAAPASGVFRVEVSSPFGYPLFGVGRRLTVESRAPMYTQPFIRETGDNASR